LLGLGVASFSHAAGVHFQNLTEIEPYLAAVNAGELPLKRAFRTSPEERMIREFILQMKLGHVSFGYFTEKFGVDLAQRFAEQFEHLSAEGLLKLTDTEVKLSRDGLLCVDAVLHEFFLQQHRTSQIV
jgi:oxygen-independent coproporphyrinogen-3 oxidase